MVDGPGHEFDLSAFRATVLAGSRRGVRIFFLLGLGFALLGVACVAFVWYESGYPGLTAVSFLLATFVGVGGLFFWTPLVSQRPWDTPKTLRVDPSGVQVKFESGRVKRHEWNEEGLAISVQEPVVDATPRPGGTGEFLSFVPGTVGGVVGREARQALLEEAARQGLAYLEERYVGIRPGERDRPVPLVYRCVARPLFGSIPPTEAWPFPEPPLPAGGAAVPTFDLVKGRYRADALGIDGAVRAGSLAIEATGLRIVRANGAVQPSEFADPKFRVTVARRMESAVTPIDAPRALWHISFGRTESGLFVSGAARSALVDAAASHGLEVSSARTPFPDRPIWRWVAETRIRHPRRR